MKVESDGESNTHLENLLGSVLFRRPLESPPPDRAFPRNVMRTGIQMVQEGAADERTTAWFLKPVVTRRYFGFGQEMRTERICVRTLPAHISIYQCAIIEMARLAAGS